jgi:hypothetical protein
LADPFSFVRERTARHGAVVLSRLKSRRGTVPDRFPPERGDGRMPYTVAPQGSGSALTSLRCAGVERFTLVLQVFFAELVRDPQFTLPDQIFRLDGSPIPGQYRRGMQVRFESGARLS